MSSKRIFLVVDSKGFTPKLFLDEARRYIKGFLRLGHDIQVFNCNHALSSVNRLGWHLFAGQHSKRRATEILTQQLELYKPDTVFVGLPKMVNAATLLLMREAAPRALFVGVENDVRPEFRPGRIDTASKLDLLFTSFGANGQQALKHAGIKCIFMPNACDPDVEHHYQVSEEWRSNVIFTGKLKHRHTATEQMRAEIITRLERMDQCAVYGCCNRHFLGGMDYYYAISGAKMGLSINLANDIQSYHSDRLTHYLACGTLVLAKSVPDSNRMFQDGVHLRYFDTEDQFFELVARYLRDEKERETIARTGMDWIHREFNSVKIVQYMLEAVETGSYRAPWS